MLYCQSLKRKGAEMSMKSVEMYIRMVLRRKIACALVVLFTAAATVFLLVYPQLIEETRLELEVVYDSTTVNGWLINTKGYEEPIIPLDIYRAIIDSEYVGAYDTYSSWSACILSTESLSEWQMTLELVDSNNVDDARMNTFQKLLAEKQPSLCTIYAVNQASANDELQRQAKKISWANGYDENCLSSSELVCLLPEFWGYQPGEIAPIQVVLKSAVRNAELKSVILPFCVAGVYPHSGTIGAFIPIGALERICVEQDWSFNVRDLLFEVADNRKLPELKDMLRQLGLGAAEAEKIQAVIDDRVLDGALAPIKSNLAMMEGLYRFFFAVVAALGFFLCFLLVRGRKPEYAVMRLLGESRAQVTFKALLEQMILCVCGIMLGVLALIIAGQGSLNVTACGIILACYTLGAALAVLLTVRVNVMEILRNKE